MPMQLKAVEGIAMAEVQDILMGFINEDAYTFGMSGQVAGHLTDIATRLGPENQTEPVDTQGLDVTDVGAFTHATYFDD